MNLPSQEQLKNIYGETGKSTERFQSLAGNFKKIYHHEDAEFFTSPGRTEMIGNHTDHNGGKVIAASIDMDTIGAAYPNGSQVIHITSEGYKQEIVVDLTKLKQVEKVAGTKALLAGIMEGAVKQGFAVGGFDAYISTNVIAAAGVSSSASFEMLICAIVNYFFNENRMTYVDYARIGQYAENVYWEKASGMMDQMACAIGGAVLFDFAGGTTPKYEKLDFSFDDFGYKLVIVNTGKGHGDLSQEYSAVPKEMGEAAKVLGVKLLHESNLEELLAHCKEITNDRAILRAMHFFEETGRVEKAMACIEEKKYDELLGLIKASGTSSWELLQNCYSLQDCTEQKVTLTLALTDVFLNRIGRGVSRVHGGGFAGVIACLVPQEDLEDYVKYISEYVGEDNVYPMSIRKVGAVHISK